MSAEDASCARLAAEESLADEVERLRVEAMTLTELLQTQERVVHEQSQHLESVLAELRRSALDTSRLFTLSLDMICIAGTDGYFKRVNPAFEQTLGYSSAMLVSRPFMDFVHPDDVAATQAEVARLATGAPTISFENRYLCSDGSYRWLAWKASPVPEDGMLYAVARDVTDRKEALDEIRDREAYLRAVVDSAVDAIVTIDRQGTIESFNLAAERAFQWTEAEVLKRNVRVLMPEPYHSQHDGYLRRYAETGERRIIGIGREIQGRRKDGSVFPIDLSVIEVKLVSGHKFLGYLRDLTEKKRAAQQESASLAREAHQQGRIEMAAGILHDLGNALTGIGARAVDVRASVQRGGEHDQMAHRTGEFLRANMASLKTSLGDAKAEALLNLMVALAANMATSRAETLESTAKLLAYVSHAQELLTTHRSYSGAGSGPPKETMNLAKLLFDARMMTADALTKRKGSVEVRVLGRAPSVRLERSKLIQVLVNLIKNAAEAFDSAPPGPQAPEVILSVDHDSLGWFVEVRDNGPGFDETVRDRLFEEGFSTKNRGSGAGLASARRVVESIGGKLHLSSPGMGRGASARIDLPEEIVVHDRQ